MNEGNGIVDHTKKEPGHHERGSKQGELVSPLHVDDGGPQVLEVEQVYAIHFVDSHVAVSTLGHDSGSAGLEASSGSVLHQGSTGHADVNRVHGQALGPPKEMTKKDVPLLSHEVECPENRNRIIM